MMLKVPMLKFAMTLVTSLALPAQSATLAGVSVLATLSFPRSGSSDWVTAPYQGHEIESPTGYFTTAVQLSETDALVDTLRSSGELIHWVYCAEFVAVSPMEVLSVFQAPVPKSAMTLDEGDIIVDWVADIRTKALIKQDVPRRRALLPPLRCAPRSRWTLQKDDAYAGDVWRIVLPEGLLFENMPNVTLTQRLGRAYYFTRGIGYLRWAQSVADTVKEEAARCSSVVVADLGCGAGWMGSIILRSVPKARVHFADIDPIALDEVKLNVRDNGVEEFATLGVGDLFEGFDDSMRGSFDHIFFYPAQSDIERGAVNHCFKPEVCVIPDVAYYAPSELYFFERVNKDIRNWLRPGGTLWLGVDDHLVEAVIVLFTQQHGGTLGRLVRAVKFDGSPAVLVRIQVGQGEGDTCKVSNV